MTSHRNIIFDEFEEAQKILKEGFKNGKVSIHEASLIAKYYFLMGLTPSKIKKELISFCKLHSQNFNEIVYRDLICKALNNSSKYGLKTNDIKINVTENEINIIKSLPHIYGKILFVMLILAKNDKYNNQNKNIKYTEKFYCHSDFLRIMRIAKVYLNPIDTIKAKHFLDAEKGYISATEMNYANWEVLIIDEDSNTSIIIENINNIIKYFPLFCGVCKKNIEKENKSKKYDMCKDCYKEDLRKRKTETMRKLREK